MARLTDGKGGNIAKAQPPEKGQRLIFDDHRDAPRGFGLRITQAGGKAFILKYTFDGKQRRMTVGDWPTWSLEAAREEARLLRQKIDTGVDPLAVKKRRKADPTVKEAVDLYNDSHVDGLKSEKQIKRYFERDLIPAIGGMKVRDVRRRDIIDMVEAKAAETPTAAKHLLAYTKGLFDWCVDREYIDFSPAGSIKPKSITVKGRKNALEAVQRLRVLDNDEIQAFWSGADTCGLHPLTALALKLVLVTGQRPGEVAGMHEDEIVGDVWIVPEDRRLKTETENRVPLTPLAIQIIEKAKAYTGRQEKRRKGRVGDFIFEARPEQPLSVGALSKAVRRYREELGIKAVGRWGEWRPHDLRRTCRTGLSACGIPSEIAERVIGHGGKGIEATYNQHDYDAEKRMALEAWERRLLAITTERDPAENNIVPFKAEVKEASNGAV